MEFNVRAAELTTLLESRITNFYTNLTTFDWVIILSAVFVFVLMEGSSRKRKELSSRSSNSLSLAGFGGSDDENDPHKRKKLPVTKECNSAAIELLRNLILNILAQNETLLEDLDLTSPQSNRILNHAIHTAIEERFGHSLYNWKRMAHFVIVAGELTIQGPNCSFLLRVLSLVKRKD